MLKVQGGCDEHEKFKKLCALAASGSVAPLELSELRTHLADCAACLEVFLEYRILSTQGMSTLADAFVERQEHATWDGTGARQRLLARVRADQQAALKRKDPARAWARSYLFRRAIAASSAPWLLAACLVLAVGFGAYRLGVRSQTRAAVRATSGVGEPLQDVLQEKRAADELLARQAKRLTQLQTESSEKGREVEKLQSALRALEGHAGELKAATSQSEAQSRALSQQRDTLNAQLQALNLAVENDKAELATLRAERDRTVQQTASLEAKIANLTATNRDQERRLKDTEQYLASDRDIRELMGARKLYIADVFDVDGSSRTQKPFGRVFYTQGKSLIFYAFDLDREPGVVNASTFQVWGQRETPQGQQALPMNLGILYMDNETNRRWVMRFDDPKRLAEIDAVFVTVEPRGGSHKPTTKPFLYALLRKEANHP
jgi:hypothetical protein